jgi:hypothetical protein
MLQTPSPKTRGAACSPEGRARQTIARVSNGVHFQLPVLPGGIESQADWEAHLASLEEALQPVGAWEKLCVYRIALSAWKHFRLVRHEAAIVSAAILSPNDTFLASYDNEVPGADCVAEVLARSACELAEEFSQRGEFLLRIRALTTDNGEGVAFTAIERRQILSGIIQQLTYDDEGEEEENNDVDDTGEDADVAQNSKGHDSKQSNGDAADTLEESVVVAATQLREEIEAIAAAKGVDIKEAIQELADTLEEEIRRRQRRLEAARTHIGACLIPDERNVNRLAIYERQLDAASRRCLNDLYRAQALRRGEPVAAPLAVDVNVTGEGSNALH